MDKNSFDDYLDQLRTGKFEDAFHNLRELGSTAIPHLIEAFEAEKDDRVKSELVNIIWEIRDPSAIPFLVHVLRDTGFWKGALDGLVTLANDSVIQSLKDAKSRSFVKEKDRREYVEWIDEAIEQILEERKRR